MAIPIRAHQPWGPRPAPRSIPMPGGLNGWTGSYDPAKLKRVGKLLAPALSPRNIRFFGLGGALATYVIGELLEEALKHMMLSLNGLSFVRLCDPLVAMDGYGTSSTLSSCFTGQGSITSPLRNLPGQVQSIPPGNTVYFRMMGYKTLFFGFPRYNENSTYVALPTALPVRPRPFWYRPHAYRVPSVYAPMARPGFVPREVAPWPVWAMPRPALPIPAPTPNAPAVPHRPGGIGTGRRWEYGMRNPARSQPIPDNPAITRVTPMPRTDETKIGANTPAGQLFMGLMRAREGVSELMDFVEVLFKSLPKRIQRRFGGSKASNADMIEALLAHWKEIDGYAFLFNLLANQIEDEIIGRSYFKARKETSKAANILGANGEVASPFFKEYGKAVSELAKEIARAVLGEQGEYNLAERRLPALMERAEAAYKKWLDDIRKSPAPRPRRNPASPGYGYLDT